MIGTVYYKGGGKSLGVVLRDGEKQGFAYGESDNEEALRQEIQTRFPGIHLLQWYVYQKECERLGAEPFPPVKREPPPTRKFAAWERVQWKGDFYTVSAEVSLLGSGWVYTLIDKNERRRAAVEAELTKAEQVPPEENVWLDAPHKAGEVISWRGHQYRVISNSYISSKEGADIEDANDVFDAAGYHCHLRLIHETQDKVQQVLDEQVHAGQARLLRVNGVESVQFADETEPIALSDLAYSGELGLYQRSRFNG